MNTLLIVWKDSDCLGIPIIDEQHRALVCTINSLYYLLRTKQVKEVLPSVISTLQLYLQVHSGTEERILELAEYPALAHHKELHAKLLPQSIAASYKSMHLNDPLEVLNLLKDWWLIHIHKEDRAYVPCVAKYMCALNPGPCADNPDFP